MRVGQRADLGAGTLRSPGQPAMTRLLDRVLTRRASPLAAVPVPASVVGPVGLLVVEVERGGIRYKLQASHVRAIASHVSWLASPGGVPLGLVGNAPKRSICAGEPGQAAVVLRTDDGDLLVPFDRLRVRRSE